MSRMAWVVGVTAGLFMCVDAAEAANARVYAKPGETAASVAAEQASCKKAISEAGVGAAPVHAQAPYGDYSVGGAVGAAIGGAIAQAILDAQVRAARVPVCMRARGFARLELSEEEQAAYAKAPEGQARDAWMDQFLSGDIGERVSSALQPAVTPLPTSEDAPFLVGGVRLEPDAFAISPGPVAAKGVLVTGVGHPRRTARLKADSQITFVTGFWKPVPATAQAGARFIQVHQGRPVKSETDEDWTLWCGPVVSKNGQSYTCVASGFAGYRSYAAVGQDWLSRPDPAVPLLWTGDVGLKTVFDLEEATSDDTYEIALRVAAVSKKNVTLSAVAMKDGAEVEFWSGVLTFDDAGSAQLPFWTQTLTLTRGDKAVTAAFEPRSDGKGWYD